MSHEIMRPLDDTLVVVDLDRTLFDTEAFALALERSVKMYITQDQYSALRQKKNAERGQSFDMVDFIKHTLKVDIPTYEDLKKYNDNRDFLIPGAAEFLGRLNEAQVAHMIMTYGGDEGQAMKLDIARQELEALGQVLPPAVITRRKSKAMEIDETWERNPSGEFAISLRENNHDEPTTVYKQRIVIIDDKPDENGRSKNPFIACIAIRGDTNGEGVTIGDVTLEDLTRAQNPFVNTHGWPRA